MTTRGAMATTSTKDGNVSNTYTFSSQPRPVKSERRKYRDPRAEKLSSTMPTNMMFDPRIVRGSTVRKQRTAEPDPIEMQRAQEAQRRRQAKKRLMQRTKPRTPEPVEGRKHMDVQTELYLEELTDQVDEADVAVQTDAFLDRPPSPLFIPPKTGVDVATQILEGDLFDFDVEVEPILEVLVGKTLEQSLMEVMEEEELASLRDHQREFEELRNAELIETQRMEEQTRRREAEKRQRIEEQRQALERQRETEAKISARVFAQNYLSELVPSVFSSLQTGGYFFDVQEREIESQFMPWLMDNVEARLDNKTRSQRLLDAIIRQVVAQRHAMYAQLKQAESNVDTSSSADADGTSGEEGSGGNDDAVSNDDQPPAQPGDAAEPGADDEDGVKPKSDADRPASGVQAPPAVTITEHEGEDSGEAATDETDPKGEEASASERDEEDAKAEDAAPSE